MKHHALFDIFEKAVNLKLSSAANYRWRFSVRSTIYMDNFCALFIWFAYSSRSSVFFQLKKKSNVLE